MDVRGVGVTEDQGHLAAYEVEEDLLAFDGVQACEAFPQTGCDGRVGGGCAARTATDQRAEQRRHLSLGAQRRQVETGGHAGGVAGGQGRVEEGQPLRHRKRRNTGTTQPVR
ncbi:hypothetical protein, partial [Streptomyces noursei]|uniref:hypothetical protein n=1 Tax=Streptomyces noursei TaxID=1971 RepID=UPI0005612B5B